MCRYTVKIIRFNVPVGNCNLLFSHMFCRGGGDTQSARSSIPQFALLFISFEAL